MGSNRTELLACRFKPEAVFSLPILPPDGHKHYISAVVTCPVLSAVEQQCDIRHCNTKLCVKLLLLVPVINSRSRPVPLSSPSALVIQRAPSSNYTCCSISGATELEIPTTGGEANLRHANHRAAVRSFGRRRPSA